MEEAMKETGAPKPVRIYTCEDQPDAIFTAVYEAYTSRYGHRWIEIETKQDCRNLKLFANYYSVSQDAEKAGRVWNAIQNKISQEALERSLYIALSDEPEKGTLLYRFLVLGFTMGAQVCSHFTHPVVQKVFELSRGVGHELHQYLGFLRFQEIKGKFLCAVFEPKNNITELVAPHFADRFSKESFFIFDKKRKQAAVHPAGCEWFLTKITEKQQLIIEQMTQKEEYQELWTIFFQNIAVSERRNLKLQRSQLALHFRTHMTEFH